MDLSSCYQLGYVQRTHGLKGELQIFLDTDLPDRYKTLESVLVRMNDELVPFFIESIRIDGNKGILKFDSVTDIDRAREFVSCGLFLPVSQLPSLDQDQFYYHELIGCSVTDARLGKLGTIKEVLDLPRQPVIVMLYKDSEVLIPVTDSVTGKLDRKNKNLKVNLPEGLLEVYLGNQKDEN